MEETGEEIIPCKSKLLIINVIKQSFSCRFDVEQTLNSIVSINTRIPENSFSAEILGTQRKGYGTVIRDDGLIVTIGYVITEAESIWIGYKKDNIVPGYVVGNDYDSGIGLVKPLMPMNLPVVEFGTTKDMTVGDPVLVASSGGSGHMMESRVVGKHEFAGRWEYVLDEAIFTSPVNSDWAGAALIGEDGKLYGVGCLLIQEMKKDKVMAGSNMFVPIDVLTPIMDELCHYGGRKSSARPWLGMLVEEELGHLIVMGVFHKCPADRSGLIPGDIIVAVNNKPVEELAMLFRSIWSMGNAGVEIPFKVIRESSTIDIIVKSSDRESSMRLGLIN